jgi:glycosyltransferase involved in cell wall biosynthesis
LRITVFFQHYHTPDCATAARPWALVERLAREHDVRLITTGAWRSLRMTDQYDWVPHDAELVELDVPYDNAMTARERMASYARYALRALAHGLRGPRPDLVFASSTPLTVPAAAAAVAALRGVPWIFEVRDLWPDFPIQMGAVSSPLLRRGLYALEHALYVSADHVVTVSPDMTRHVQTAVPPDRVSTIPYGTDLALHARAAEADLEDLRRAFDLPDAPLVLYAGSFGRANDVPTLLAAARRLRENRPREDDAPTPCFVFAGSGYHRPRIAAAARKHANVRLLDPQPRERMLRLFRLADLSVVAFIDRPILATNGPSKLYDSLGAGTPVVVTSDGWTRRLVERADCGWYVPPSDPVALAARIAELFAAPDALSAAGPRARATAHAHFDRTADMDRYAALVRQVGG